MSLFGKSKGSGSTLRSSFVHTKVAAKDLWASISRFTDQALQRDFMRPPSGLKGHSYHHTKAEQSAWEAELNAATKVVTAKIYRDQALQPTNFRAKDHQDETENSLLSALSVFERTIFKKPYTGTDRTKKLCQHANLYNGSSRGNPESYQTQRSKAMRRPQDMALPPLEDRDLLRDQVRQIQVDWHAKRGREIQEWATSLARTDSWSECTSLLKKIANSAQTLGINLPSPVKDASSWKLVEQFAHVSRHLPDTGFTSQSIREFICDVNSSNPSANFGKSVQHFLAQQEIYEKCKAYSKSSGPLDQDAGPLLACQDLYTGYSERFAIRRLANELEPSARVPLSKESEGPLSEGDTKAVHRYIQYVSHLNPDHVEQGLGRSTIKAWATSHNYQVLSDYMAKCDQRVSEETRAKTDDGTQSSSW